MGYLLQQRLGRGGMGVVDLALDERGRPVALKRLALYGSVTEMARARARVRREAEALGRLRHPNIVPLLDLVDEGDDLVLVMPYLAGGTLADQVRAYGPLRPEQVMALAGPLLAAVATAHAAGIVHRDIKPGNVLFDLEGRPFLSDFGIASFRDATSGLTATGTVLGTADFMAPEQARGERAEPATDVFALGATLLFAATGRRPYGEVDSRVALHRAAHGRLEPLPALDPAVAQLVRPMLRVTPNRRPTAARLATSLAPVARARRWRISAAAAAFAVVAAAGGVLVWQASQPAPGAPALAAPPTTVASTETAPSTTAPCKGLPYQPCGQPAAPHTDGSSCTDDHADYDGDPTNGCEAAPDKVDGSTLNRSITANLVPGDDTDRYPFHVDDNFQWDCSGEVVITLTAPAGTNMRLEVRQAGSVIGTGVAAAGRPAVVRLTEAACGGDDSGDFEARVRYEGPGRSASSYRLEKSGSF